MKPSKPAVVKLVIGLMSGTSMDGIDAALIKTDGGAIIEPLVFLSHNYSPAFRQCLKDGLNDSDCIQNRNDRPGQLAELEQRLTLAHAELVHQLLRAQNLTLADIDLIGFHGQTMLHRPDEALTVQIGDGSLLARKTGIDVVYDMRAQDMAHGGQGAPLVPAYHAALAAKLASKLSFPVAFVNIGGISNLTFVKTPILDQAHNLAAFDCGPGNSLIDQWMELMAQKAFDEDGRTAKLGKVDEVLVAQMLDNPLFCLDRHRSFDWRDFKPLQKDRLSLADGAATLSYFTAAAIYNSFQYLPEIPKTLVICGGGARNGAIIGFLQKLGAHQGVAIRIAEDIGLQSGAIEAQAWGYLAVRSLLKLPLTYPETTGCRAPVSGGVFVSAKI